MTSRNSKAVTAPGMAGRGKALAALVLGVLSVFGGFVFVGIFAAVAAVFVGFFALRQISDAQVEAGDDEVAAMSFKTSRLFVYGGYFAAFLGTLAFLFMTWTLSLYSEGFRHCEELLGPDNPTKVECAQDYVRDHLLP